MARPRAALDRGGMQPVDVELIAQLFQEPQFAFVQRSIRRTHVTGQGIGRLVKPLRQVRADETKQRIKPIFDAEQVENGPRDHANPVHIVIRKNRQIVDGAFDFHQFGSADVFVRGGNGNHDGHKAILRGKGMFDLLGHWVAFQACAVAVQNIDCCAPRQ